MNPENLQPKDQLREDQIRHENSPEAEKEPNPHAHPPLEYREGYWYFSDEDGNAWPKHDIPSRTTQRDRTADRNLKLLK